MSNYEIYRAKIEDLAKDMGIKLYGRFTSHEAADILGLSIPTLNRIRARGDIAYLRLGDRQVRFFGFQLLEYMLQSIEEVTCRAIKNLNEPTNAATIGLERETGLTGGTDSTMTQTGDAQSELASALRILRKPKENSTTGTP